MLYQKYYLQIDGNEFKICGYLNPQHVLWTSKYYYKKLLDVLTFAGSGATIYSPDGIVRVDCLHGQLYI